MLIKNVDKKMYGLKKFNKSRTSTVEVPLNLITRVSYCVGKVPEKLRKNPKKTDFFSI